jgi:hypothetical protein
MTHELEFMEGKLIVGMQLQGSLTLASSNAPKLEFDRSSGKYTDSYKLNMKLTRMLSVPYRV